MNNENLYYYIIRELIDISRKMQLSSDHRRGYLPRELFIEECCTIKLQVPRGTGKTTAINELLEVFDSAIVVTHKRDQNRNYNTKMVFDVSTSYNKLRGVPEIKSSPLVLIDSVPPSGDLSATIALLVALIQTPTVVFVYLS